MIYEWNDINSNNGQFLLMTASQTYRIVEMNETYDHHSHNIQHSHTRHKNTTANQSSISKNFSGFVFLYKGICKCLRAASNFRILLLIFIMPMEKKHSRPNIPSNSKIYSIQNYRSMNSTYSISVWSFPKKNHQFNVIMWYSQDIKIDSFKIKHWTSFRSSFSKKKKNKFSFGSHEICA